MSNRFFKSIRFKVVLWYMLFLTLTLLTFSVILYGSFDKILYGDLDDLLSSRAEGVADSINAYRQAQKTEGGDFIAIARNWVEEKSKDPELMSVFVRILDTKGTILVSSKSIPRIEAMPKDDLADILKGEDSFDMVNGESLDAKKIKFRVYTKPVIEDGKVAYVVQVAGPLGLVALALNNLILVLFVLLPLTVLLAGIPGVLLVRLTLRPVDGMINTLRQITAENLKLKIHLPDTKDEIKRLADTFNDMLGRLDRSFSSQQRFIQDISQELKSPVTILRKDFETALKGSLSVEEYKDLILRASAEIADFSNIIEDLLTLSLFDNEQMALEIKKVNIARLLDEVLADVKPRAEEKDIAISSFLQHAITLDGDERQFKQLFRNILDNAIKYTYRKGKVTVSANSDGKFARVTISDTGIGMEEDELPYIFDRFYQVNRPRAANNSFGLGLSIAKSVAEAHKGAINVESEVGKGSVFTVLLPLSYPG